MDEVLQVRMWWSVGLIFGGLVLPFIIWCFIIKPSDPNINYKGLAFVVYVVLFFKYSQNLIPEKYDIETIKVKECIYVEKIVPKYPDALKTIRDEK